LWRPEAAVVSMDRAAGPTPDRAPPPFGKNQNSPPGEGGGRRGGCRVCLFFGPNSSEVGCHFFPGVSERANLAGGFIFSFYPPRGFFCLSPAPVGAGFRFSEAISRFVLHKTEHVGGGGPGGAAPRFEGAQGFSGALRKNFKKPSPRVARSPFCDFGSHEFGLGAGGISFGGPLGPGGAPTPMPGDTFRHLANGVLAFFAREVFGPDFLGPGAFCAYPPPAGRRTTAWAGPAPFGFSADPMPIPEFAR